MDTSAKEILKIKTKVPVSKLSEGMTSRDSNTSSNQARKVATAVPEEERKNFSIEEIMELGDDALGLRIHVTARGGDHMGVINYILPDCRRLALEKVCNPKTGKKRIGMLTVFFHNIINISVIGEDKEARQRLLRDVYHEDQCGKQLLMKKIVPPHLVKRQEEASCMDEDVLLGRVESLHLDSNNTVNKADQEPPPPPTRIPRPDKWVVIDTMDEAFKKALSHIESEKVVSVGMEGRKLGRTGTLAWVSVATSSIIFLFDVAKMGAADVFKEGLGSVLMSPSIMKIVHDCRPMEDILHHQFSTNLVNVFDTQAAEVYLFMINHRSAVPSFVSSLPSLLIRYLGLAPHHVFFPHVRHECSESDEGVWLERPLSPNLCEGLARSVMYLRELHLVLVDLMLVDLSQITQIYLGSLRDKDSISVAKLESHIVPEEVQRLRRRSVNNSVTVRDPYITYSRDAVRISAQGK